MMFIKFLRVVIVHLYIFLGGMSVWIADSFSVGLIVFVLSSYKSSLYISLDTWFENIRSMIVLDTWFENIFLYYVRCCLFFMGSFETQKFLLLMKPNLSIYSFAIYTPNKSLFNPRSWWSTYMFSSKICTVFVLIFKSMILSSYFYVV